MYLSRSISKIRITAISTLVSADSINKLKYNYLRKAGEFSKKNPPFLTSLLLEEPRLHFSFGRGIEGENLGRLVRDVPFVLVLALALSQLFPPFHFCARGKSRDYNCIMTKIHMTLTRYFNNTFSLHPHTLGIYYLTNCLMVSFGTDNEKQSTHCHLQMQILLHNR